MKGRIKWVQDVMFVAESGSGHGIVLDGAPESGGRNLGMRPMELMALGVGSCSSYDVVTILKKVQTLLLNSLQLLLLYFYPYLGD